MDNPISLTEDETVYHPLTPPPKKKKHETGPSLLFTKQPIKMKSCVSFAMFLPVRLLSNSRRTTHEWLIAIHSRLLRYPPAYPHDKKEKKTMRCHTLLRL
jgi:hypothetical protein